MVCILYVIAVGTLLGLAGMVVERMLPPTTTSRRWIWCSVIGTSIIVPPLYRANHTSSITDLLRDQAAGDGLGHALATSSLGIFDPAWWQQTLSWSGTISQVWLIGSATLVIWGVLTAARITVLLRRSRRSTSAPRDVIDGIPVLVTDSIGPATVGVIRSRVVVPRWVLALPGVQRKYVLRHEEEHRKSHDSLLLFVASLTLLLTPWNLALWWQLRRLRLAVEMDCDNRVVSALGDPDTYGELLFKVAQASSRGPRLQPAFLGAGLLERRLTALVAPAPLRRAQKFILPVLACVLLFIVISMPHPVVGSKSHEHAATATATPHSSLTR
jgi:beta-lactamase regulating signal transducer with metallopeptidase domain